MAVISINTMAKIITPAKFQKRCESLLKQKFVRFTEKEKQEIENIKRIPNVSQGFKNLSLFLKEKYNTIAGIEGKWLFDQRKKHSIKPETAADIFDKIIKYNEKVFKFFSDLTYQSTSSPYILKVEQALKKKGIKAKFSNNTSTDYASLTKEALEDIAKKGYELPERIFVSALVNDFSNGFVNMGPTTPAGTIFINSQRAGDTYTVMKNQRKSDYLTRFKSTDNPKHGMYHETAHWLHSRMGLKEL